MFTQYTDALALMSGFAAHDHSFVTKIKNTLWHLKGNLRISSTRITNAT